MIAAGPLAPAFRSRSHFFILIRKCETMHTSVFLGVAFGLLSGFPAFSPPAIQGLLQEVFFCRQNRQFHLDILQKSGLQFIPQPPNLAFSIWRRLMADRELTCTDCGNRFVFTEGEQEFYKSKGFQHLPRRCRRCRSVPRAGRSRVDTSATCADCGKGTTIPFKPSQNRPVFCRDCFEKRKHAGIRSR